MRRVLTISTLTGRSYCGFNKIVQHHTIVVKGAGACFVCKINPCFRRVYKVQIHIPGHRIQFMPDSSGLIIKSVLFGQTDGGFDFDGRHKDNHRPALFQNSRSLRKESVHSICPLITFKVIPTRSPKEVVTHFFEVGISAFHKVAEIIRRISKNQVYSFCCSLRICPLRSAILIFA